MKRICMATLVLVTWVSGLPAQVMKSTEAPEPKPKAIAPGAVSPSFWIGGKAVVIAGRNFETGASGLSYTDTWGSFNFALVDSRYDITKLYATPVDPSIWSGYFALKGPTARINSWETTTEFNWPAWQAGLQGEGFRFGFLSEGGDYLQGGNSSNVPSSSTLSISGANKGILLGDRIAGVDRLYLNNTETVVTVNYPVTGMAFAGWESPGLVKTSLTVGMKDKATAGLLSAEFTPLGSAADLDHPLTFKLGASAIAGSGYKMDVTNNVYGNPLGLSVSGQLDFFLDDDMVLSPQAALDLRFNDTTTAGVTLPSGSQKADWKAAGGLLLSLSPKKWVNDDWTELPSQGAGFQNFEYSKIQKFSYLQLLADYGRSAVTEKQKDLNLNLRFEEPDGIVGFDENWGAMVEYSLANLLQADSSNKLGWSAAARISYDLVAHKYSPYVRVFTDNTQVVRFRTGLQVAVVPGCAIELTYMTKNLNGGAKAGSGSAIATDAGRIELIVGLSSDSSYNRTPKNMSFDYTGY